MHISYVNAGDVVIENGKLDANNNLYVNEAGSVGIGTLIPNRKLEVSGGGDQFIMVTSSNDLRAGIQFFRPGNDFADWSIEDFSGSLRFRVSGDDFASIFTRMIVTPSGNVGIGTLNPNEKLAVAGNVNISGTLNVSQRITFASLSNCNTIGADIDGVLGCGTGSGFGSGTGGPSQWNSTGNNVYLNDSRGTVGIGTSTPIRNLHIKNKTADTVVVIDSGDGASQYYSAIDLYDNNAPKWGIGKDRFGNFYIDKSGVGTALSIDGVNQNFGIGTSSESVAKLTVGGQIKIIGGNPTAGRVLTSDTNGLASWQPPIGGGVPPGSFGETLRHNGTRWVSNEFLYNNGSRIGIGTVTPQKNLHIKNETDDTVLVIDSGNEFTGKYSALDFYDNNLSKWGIGKNPTGDFYIDQAGVGNAITIEKFNRNVGIGQTTPNVTLGVSGRVNITGYLEVGDEIRTSNGFRDYQRLLGLGTKGILGRGDANGDGVVDRDDADYIRRYRAGLETTCPFIDCDVTGNGLINENDASTLNLYLLGYSELPASMFAVYVNQSNVGINTTTPAQTLTVVGTLNVTSQRTRSNDFFVNSDGNVGVGTSNPAQKLDVQGQIHATDDICTDIAGGKCLGMMASASSSQWNSTGNNVYLNDTNANVGIGTSAPSRRLYVKTNLTDNVLVIDSGDSTAEQYSAVDLYNDGTPKWGIGKNPAGDFYIDQAGIERVFTISDSDRNVSVGPYTLPAAKFHISGGLSGKENRILLVQSLGGLAGTATTIRLTNDILARTTGSAEIVANRTNAVTTGDTDLIFRTSAGSTLTERMRIIGSTGNIGVGANKPGSKLTVAGTFNASGSLNGPGLLVDSSGNVGIGTFTPISKLSVNVTYSSPSIEKYGASIYSNSNVPRSPSTFGGLKVNSRTFAADLDNPSHNPIGVRGLNIYVDSQADIAFGISGIVSQINLFAPTVQNVSGMTILRTIRGAGSIANNYGIHLESQTAGTNNYGIYIQNMTGASSWPIYSSGGNIYFAGNLGIGVKNPAQKLDVDGDVSWSGTLQSGSVPWARLVSFPAACPGGQYVTTIGGVLTCSTPSFVETDPTVRSWAKTDTPTIPGDTVINGNVGIGTLTTPGEKLNILNVDVNELKFSGATQATNVYSDANMYIRSASGVFLSDTLTSNVLSITGGNIGIGTTSSGAKLEVAGQVKITGGSPGAGKVLTSDASGLASWQTSPGLPSGTSGQTLRHDGSNWVANSVLFNDGSNVGIGTTPTGAKLDIQIPAIDSTTNLLSIAKGTNNYFTILNSGDISWAGTLQSGSVPWARLVSFPAACPAGQYVEAVGGTLTCSTPPELGDSTPDTIADDGIISDDEASDVLTINNGLLNAPTSGTVEIGAPIADTTVKLNVNGVIKAACPSDMTDAGRFCIETNERAAGQNWFSAIDTCGDLGRGLCAAQEWYYACANYGGSLGSITGNWEWTDERYTSAAVYVMGLTTCTSDSVSVSEGSTAIAFRCCVDKKLSSN